MQLSNENIIFMYLKTKHEIIDIDLLSKQFEEYINALYQKIENLKLDNFSKELETLKVVSKLFGNDLSKEQLKELEEKAKEKNKQKLDELNEENNRIIKESLSVRIGIIKELELPFQVLKEEMPETVKKYEKLITSNIFTN